MTYLELSVRAPDSAEETFAAAIAASRGLGAWVEPGGVLRAYFTDGGDPVSRFDRAWRALTGGPCPYRIECSAVAEEDWSARWRATLHPIAVTSRLWVAPPGSWPGLEAPGRTVVWIEPGLGFGTGSHPTTKALLRGLETAPRRATVLDVGTGSGVLAIAAIALGARRCVALDIDPDAISSATANAHRNGVAHALELVTGSLEALDAGRRFERVVANLDASTFATHLEAVVERCAPGGDVGVAGLLESDRLRFLDHAKALGLKLRDQRRDRDASLDDVWWSAWFERPAGLAR